MDKVLLDKYVSLYGCCCLDDEPC
ncbi:hypothetical protein LCGC14_2433460, partial [marine sediment metagenome]